MKQDVEQGVFLEEGGREVLRVADQTVIGLRPVHGEVKAILVTLRGVGEVATVGAVRDHKQLQILV